MGKSSKYSTIIGMRNDVSNKVIEGQMIGRPNAKYFKPSGIVYKMQEDKTWYLEEVHEDISLSELYDPHERQNYVLGEHKLEVAPKLPVEVIPDSPLVNKEVIELEVVSDENNDIVE